MNTFNVKKLPYVLSFLSFATMLSMENMVPQLRNRKGISPSRAMLTEYRDQKTLKGYPDTFKEQLILKDIENQKITELNASIIYSFHLKDKDEEKFNAIKGILGKIANEMVLAVKYTAFEIAQKYPDCTQSLYKYFLIDIMEIRPDFHLSITQYPKREARGPYSHYERCYSNEYFQHWHTFKELLIHYGKDLKSFTYQGSLLTSAYVEVQFTHPQKISEKKPL